MVGFFRKAVSVKKGRFVIFFFLEVLSLCFGSGVYIVVERCVLRSTGSI